MSDAALGAQVTERVRARVREELSGPEASLCAEFVTWFYRLVPADELTVRDVRDLAGAAITTFRAVAARRRGEPVVIVHNPDLERDGWQSRHTAVILVGEDMPFIVDSVTLELARAGYPLHLAIHPVLRVRRGPDHRLTGWVERDTGASGLSGASDPPPESVLYVEVEREPDPERRAALQNRLERVLTQVRAAVRDWQPMRGAALACSDELAAAAEAAADPERREELEEATAFLRWLARDHFTFLGYRDYDLRGGTSPDTATLVPVADSGLGILRGSPRRPQTHLSVTATALARRPAPLVLTKANSRSTVHRGAYLDYVGVKRFGDDGQVIGERRLLGLYTSAAYRESTHVIPLVGTKVRQILAASGFPPDSHDAKALMEILESYPRDSLFGATPDELYDIALGVLSAGERRRVRLFLRPDALGRFVECLVLVPRERFNTTTRERIMAILAGALGGEHVDWTVLPSDSLLTRVHFIVRSANGTPPKPHVAALEARLAHAIRSWEDGLRQALEAEHDEERARELATRYGAAFPAAYRDERDVVSAVSDIAQLEELGRRHEPIIVLGRAGDGPPGTIRAKLFSASPVALSDVLPTFEHLGAAVVDEHPYEINPGESEPVWMYDFGLRGMPADIEARGELFCQAFLGVWRGEFEDDGLGALVLTAGLDGRQVTIVRAVARYLRQAGLQYSNAYMERTLIGHPAVSRLLVELFAARLDPDRHDPRRAEWLAERITAEIDGVESLDEDRILRAFLGAVLGVLRTNHFQGERRSDARPCLAFKLDPEAIDVLPEPRPRYEIFVYSPHVEGIHLRGGKVARGGLRWSDRPEDFRTEVLGLMKAQMVKNALIVPVGSKGGFVVKRAPAGDREALQQEAIECYRTFLSGLLDLTDNIVAGEIVPPPRVVRHDEDDPYLVVAADKGTATFSDVANGVSADYGFWLGDAFASGGSHGYDHKQMGITARGAWESVRRHFRELGTDVDTEDFTVVGIGDMSGDVFGNGMLLSRHIRLLAAFNHAHIFIDPDPDPALAFAERRRLFGLPRSSWADYDAALLSAGGGIYARSAKRIALSDPARAVLGIERRSLSPAELIRELLQAPVDLLWNGGIGTYVKASTESHADAGDKAGDAVRVDGRELRCRVVAEGGNLGFTQRGRIEFALGGGRINTDAIDNVAGVNCSDHEVNIKILLDGRVADGELSSDDRNALLSEMTGGVAERVIAASRSQTQAISLARHQAAGMIGVHARLIRRLESVGGLHRGLGFLPGEEEISDRAGAGEGLSAPELAVLMAYTKIGLYAELLESDLPEDGHLGNDLERYFPDPLPDRYPAAMHAHRLRREIIATTVANQLVDRAGMTFALRLGEETGAGAAELARGYAVAREVFEMPSFWSAVEALDNRAPARVQLEMLIEARRLVERSARWLVRASPRGIDVAACVERHAPGAQMLRAALPDLLSGEAADRLGQTIAGLRDAGVPEPLARRVAAMPVLLPGFDIVIVSSETGRAADLVMRVHFGLGQHLELDWLREQIVALPRDGRWEALARAALRDDLAALHRELTVRVLGAAPDEEDAERAIARWSATVPTGLVRARRMIEDIRSGRSTDTTTLPVALRELRGLTA